MKSLDREMIPGVSLRVIETDRFKTCSFHVSFLTQHQKETASANALVPYVLRRGCKRLATLQDLNSELDYLYGASIEPFVYKQGDVQYIGFSCDGIDDRFATGDESIPKSLFSLVHELLFDPLLENGAFLEQYVSGERENLVSMILSEKNEKLSYAYQQACEKLFVKQGFGLSAFGTLNHAKALTRESVFSAYRALLKHAPMQITYCGSESFETISEMVTSVFSDYKREVINSVSVSNPNFSDEVFDVEENQDMAQTVLLVGYHTNADEAVSKVLSAVLGGGTASKLFLNVRERASLCYYTGSVFDARQDTMFFYAGVKDETATLAYQKMTEQLHDCAQGKVDEEELSQAKRLLISKLKIIKDTAGGLLNYWLDRAVDTEQKSIEETERAIRSVTLEQVISAARACELKMIYRLCGKEIRADARKLLR
ncbi:MAG: insulinase family protein [Ruminococcaceae bacterium]|nr:insulinase family protein [Oscillospiraceae bacterium]